MFEISRHTLILIVAFALLVVGCLGSPGVEPPMEKPSTAAFDGGTTNGGAKDQGKESAAAANDSAAGTEVSDGGLVQVVDGATRAEDAETRTIDAK
jgi:hypothetical protein